MFLKMFFESIIIMGVLQSGYVKHHEPHDSCEVIVLSFKQSEEYVPTELVCVEQDVKRFSNL